MLEPGPIDGRLPWPSRVDLSTHERVASIAPGTDLDTVVLAP